MTLYWREYFSDPDAAAYLGKWAVAFLMLSGAFVLLSSAVHAFRTFRAPGSGGIKRYILEPYLAFALFCLLIPPRAGDFFSNGGTEDLLEIHLPVLVAMSLLPFWLGWPRILKFLDAPAFVRLLRRARPSTPVGWAVQGDTTVIPFECGIGRSPASCC